MKRLILTIALLPLLASADPNDALSPMPISPRDMIGFDVDPELYRNNERYRDAAAEEWQTQQLIRMHRQKVEAMAIEITQRLSLEGKEIRMYLNHFPSDQWPKVVQLLNPYLFNHNGPVPSNVNSPLKGTDFNFLFEADKSEMLKSGSVETLDYWVNLGKQRIRIFENLVRSVILTEMVNQGEIPRSKFESWLREASRSFNTNQNLSPMEQYQLTTKVLSIANAEGYRFPFKSLPVLGNSCRRVFSRP